MLDPTAHVYVRPLTVIVMLVWLAAVGLGGIAF